MYKPETAKRIQEQHLRNMEVELLYEIVVLNNKTWHSSEHFDPIKCKHCNTVYNYIDFSDGECPFCRK